MTDKEFLVSQLMRLGYSQGEAEAIVARNEIASSLVRQGIPLERALAIANQMVGSVELSGGNPDAMGIGQSHAQAGFDEANAAPVTGGLAPVGPVTSAPIGPPSEGPVTSGIAPALGVHADTASKGTLGTVGIAPDAPVTADRGGLTAHADTANAGTKGAIGTAPDAPTQSGQVNSSSKGDKGAVGLAQAISDVMNAPPEGMPNIGFNPAIPADMAIAPDMAMSPISPSAPNQATAAPIGAPDALGTLGISGPTGLAAANTAANAADRGGVPSPGLSGLGFDAGGLLGGGLLVTTPAKGSALVT